MKMFDKVVIMEIVSKANEVIETISVRMAGTHSFDVYCDNNRIKPSFESEDDARAWAKHYCEQNPRVMLHMASIVEK